MNSIIPPGIRRITQRLFQGLELVRFEHAIELGCRRNTFDFTLKRPEEADYNPRPGRLVEITIVEAGLEDITSLCCAALADLSANNFPEVFQAERQLVVNSQKLGDIEHFSRLEEALALVRLLDDVRHIHMRSDYTPAMRVQHTTAIHILLAHLKYGENTKLAKKLGAWAGRFGTKVDNEESDK